MPLDNSEEIFEIVDEQGRVIGTAPRRRCHGDPSLLHQSIHVFVLNRDGELFLQRRSLKKDTQPGKWDTSVGGHMAPGETPEQAAQRECGEELGFTPDRLEFAYSYIWRSDFESELIRAYLTHHEGPFRLDPDEIDEGLFFSAGTLDALIARGETTPMFAREYPRLRSRIATASQGRATPRGDDGPAAS